MSPTCSRRTLSKKCFKSLCDSEWSIKKQSPKSKLLGLSLSPLVWLTLKLMKSSKMWAPVSRQGFSAGRWWRRPTSGSRTGAASQTATASRSPYRKKTRRSFPSQEQLRDDPLLLQSDSRARWPGEEDVSEPLLWHPHHHPGHPQCQAHLLWQDLLHRRHPRPLLRGVHDLYPRAPLLPLTLSQEDDFEEGWAHREVESKH